MLLTCEKDWVWEAIGEYLLNNYGLMFLDNLPYNTLKLPLDDLKNP